MQVTCSCGKALNVPDSQAGKNARCPACQKVFKVPAAPASAPPLTKIPFQCSCGKRLSAPLSAGGKKVLCPACNKELVVPAAPASAAPAAAPGKPAPALPVGQAPAPAQTSVVAPQRKKQLGPAPAPAPKISTAGPPPLAPTGDEFGLALEDPVAPPPPAAKAAPVREEPEADPGKGEYVIGGMKCPHCKADLDPAAQFCVSCGTSLVTGAKTESAKIVPKKKGLQKLDFKNMNPELKKKIITAAVAIVVIGGMAIFLCIKFKVFGH